MCGVKATRSCNSLALSSLLWLSLTVASDLRSAELSPVVSGVSSRVVFEEAHADDKKNIEAGKGIDLQFGVNLIIGANFGNVDIVDSVEVNEAGDVVVNDHDGEDFAVMFSVHRRNYLGCRDENACFGWGPYIGLLTKPSGRLGGGWSLGVMGGFDSLPGAVGFGYVVREDITYVSTDMDTGLSSAAQGDFEGFAVIIGFSF